MNIKTIQLGGKKVGVGNPVFIVAEIANAHNGDFATAKEMIRRIAEVGVNAVKFQLHIPEAEMIPSHPKFITQGQRSLSLQSLALLKEYCESFGLYFLCSPFSREAADQLEMIGVDAFKIGSGEISDLPFIEHVAKKRKPMIVSTGMTTLEEIAEAVKIIKAHKTPLLLVHCISIYPPSYERLNLGVIPILRKRFGVSVGLSDHTPEIYSAIASIPYGASLIEKHYTLNRNQSGTSDHKVSLELNEWRNLVDGIRKIEKACGDEKHIFDEEHATIAWARHSVVSLRDIHAGEIIDANFISTKRPLFGGIPAKELPRIIGKKARRSIKKDNILHWNDVV